MQKFLLFFTAFILAALTLSAQYTSSDKKAIKLYQEAELYMKERNFEEAKKLLESALHKDPGFVEAHLRLAGIYKLYADNQNARVHFEKACELRPNSRDLAGAYYIVGEYYFEDGNYEKAKEYYDRTLSVNPTDKKLITNVTGSLQKANYGIEARKHPVDFKPVKLDGINLYYIQAYPVLTADQQSMIFMKKDGPRLEQDEDLMISRKVNGKWGPPVSISSVINTQFNDGAPTISADGRTLIFTRCNAPGGLGACDLYISNKEGDQWSEPKNLGPNVNSNVWDSEPSLSPDGRKLYFSSERKGGLGGMDIWVTEKDDKGEWMPARNLGKDINTSGKDVAPFIHASGNTLYFSSNFYEGMGGLDVYYSRFDGTSWSKPKNLGYPINTQIDDATIFVTPDNRKGYYGSYEKKDMRVSQAYLYEFEVPKEISGEVESSYAQGNVFDAETKQKLGAKIELIDLKTNKVSQSVSSDPVNGSYLIVLTEGNEYALYVQREGYLFKSLFFDYKNPKDFNPLTLDVYLEPIKPGKSVVLNNIFFQSNSFALEDKSKTELDKIVMFLQTNPKINIEFGGHTDDVGSDKDNLDLSMKRAKAVYDYIAAKGISPARLKYKGYGEGQPVAPNNSEQNRQLNRRIEFKVL